jgi:hypothetical protein
MLLVNKTIWLNKNAVKIDIEIIQEYKVLKIDYFKLGATNMRGSNGF